MSENSAIEWTDTTWNPVTGCTKISAGCENCYAERFSERFRGVPGHPFETGFDLTLRPERLSQPLEWKRPRMIFVNSMSDLFHKDIPKAHIAAVFDTMEKADWHVYQVLTKRSSLMQKFINDRYKARPAPAHMWFGVSVENEKATSRITHLQKTNASIRFLSIEPLIAPVGKVSLTGIDWVIVGGESGYGARPMKPEWAIDIRNQCVKAKVAFFFKQWGGRSPKTGGRLLDGKEWNQFPAKRRSASKQLELQAGA
jgi:protein gp37